MSQFKDQVRVRDAGVVRLLSTDGVERLTREWESFVEKPVVEVKGWVTAVLRQNGKIVPGSFRDGHNIWTNTGREFLAMLMSLQLAGTKFRTDSVAYIGIGTGSQIEDPGVLNLITPAAYTTGLFLAALDIPPTFPLSPSRTTVRFHRTFLESELTLGAGTRVDIAEAGLFTDGSPTASPAYNPGTRDRTIGNALQQAPVAYKSFEPLGKTDAMQLDLSWEIRF